MKPKNKHSRCRFYDKFFTSRVFSLRKLRSTLHFCCTYIHVFLVYLYLLWILTRVVIIHFYTAPLSHLTLFVSKHRVHSLEFTPHIFAFLGEISQEDFNKHSKKSAKKRPRLWCSLLKYSDGRDPRARHARRLDVSPMAEANLIRARAHVGRTRMLARNAIFAGGEGTRRVRVRKTWRSANLRGVRTRPCRGQDFAPSGFPDFNVRSACPGEIAL